VREEKKSWVPLAGSGSLNFFPQKESSVKGKTFQGRKEKGRRLPEKGKRDDRGKKKKTPHILGVGGHPKRKSKDYARKRGEAAAKRRKSVPTLGATGGFWQRKTSAGEKEGVTHKRVAGPPL